MKKLGKLQINPDRLMKNEELLILRGGDYSNCCRCTNGYYMIAPTPALCESSCSELPGQHGVWQC